MYAQAVYTHGATKKLIKEFNNIKRIEKNIMMRIQPG